MFEYLKQSEVNRIMEVIMPLIAGNGIIGIIEIGQTENYQKIGYAFDIMLGYESKELPEVLKSYEEMIYPSDLEYVINTRNGLKEGEAYTIEYRLVKKDGTHINVEELGTLISGVCDCPDKKSIIGLVQDISLRKGLELENQRIMAILDELERIGGFEIWELNVSDRMVKWMNKTPSEESLKQGQTERIEHIQDTIYQSDLDIYEEALENCLLGVTSTLSCDFRYYNDRDELKWARDIAIISEWDSEGMPTKLRGLQIDIDDLKKSERDLLKSIKEAEYSNLILENEVQSKEKDLQYTKKMSNELFYSNPQANLIFDSELNLIDCNPATIEFFGVESKQYLKDNARDFFTSIVPQYQPGGVRSVPFVQRVQESVEEGYSEFETNIIIKGELIPVGYIIKKIEYRDSYAIAIYQHDLRTLKKAQQQVVKQGTLLSAVNNLASWLLTTDDFSSAVSKSLETLGRSADIGHVDLWRNMHGDELEMVFAWTDSEHPASYAKRKNLSARTVTEKWRKILESGEKINGMVSAMEPAIRMDFEASEIKSVLIAPINFEDTFWGFIGYYDYESERVFTEAEEEILVSAGIMIGAALERNETRENLVRAKEEAQANVQAKSNFLANMSHEFRTPLNAITGMATIASNTENPEKIKDCLSKITSASKLLTSIINDVLDYSKIDSHKLTLNRVPFSFSSLVSNIRTVSMSIANEKQQNFFVSVGDDISDNLVGDEYRLTQVLANLISNACKFTNKYGEIRLNIDKVDEADTAERVRFAVIDNGIGIEESKIESLFTPFEQGDIVTSKRFGGTGLGLPISKAIVEMMGGVISVKSKIDRGSTFSFEIEIEKAFVESQDVDAVYDFSGYKVLIVEDIMINQEVVISLIEDTGIDYDCADNGEIALNAVREKIDEYDIIFMDIHMPVMDGFEATRCIRALPNEKAKTIPILAMTANAFSEDIQKCLECGMTEHIAKPIDIDELMKKISALLKNAERK